MRANYGLQAVKSHTTWNRTKEAQISGSRIHNQDGETQSRNVTGLSGCWKGVLDEQNGLVTS